MEQLLSIKRIPIKIEVNVTNAEFKRKEETAPAPSVKVSKQSDGNVVMAAQPYTVDVAAQRYDTYSAADMQNGKGVTITYNGVMSLPLSSEKPVNGESAELTARNASRSINTILNKLPKTKQSNISYNDGTLSINYKVDKPQASSASEEILDLSSGFEFIPGRIEFVVSQMPGLEIEYLGDPIYFPRSADPNYKGEVDLTV